MPGNAEHRNLWRSLRSHQNGIQEADGSIPFSSTEVETGIVVGAILLVTMREQAELPAPFTASEAVSRFGGGLVAGAGEIAGVPHLWIAARGYIGPSLLRADLALAAEFGRSHPGGWIYVADIRRVRVVNPLNVLWLRRIRRLPNIRQYVVVTPSRLVRLMLRLSSWLVRVDRVVRDPAELLTPRAA